MIFNRKYLFTINVFLCILLLFSMGLLFFIPNHSQAKKSDIFSILVMILCIIPLLNQKYYKLYILSCSALLFIIYNTIYNNLITLMFSFVFIVFYFINFKKHYKYLVLAIGSFCIFSFIYNSFTTYYVPTASMSPVIKEKSKIKANNLYYKFNSIKLNDVILFIEPTTKRILFTKRVSGVAGNIVKNESKYNRGLQQFLNKDIYVPKKGDIVSIDKVYKVNKKLRFETGKLNQLVDYTKLQEIPKEEMLSIYNKYKFNNFMLVNMIGNLEYYSLNVKNSEFFYTYTLKIQSGNNVYTDVLPIYDFKFGTFNNKLKKLLNGESIKLKQDYYFVTGDNESVSFDSRYFGFIPKNYIKGKVILK